MNKKIIILRQQDDAPKTYVFLALHAGKKKKKCDNRKKSIVWAFTLKYRQ